MVGISTSSFYGKLTTEDAVYKIADMGVSCAEVFLNTFSEYTSEYIHMISKRLHERSVLFNSVHTLPTQFEPQLFAVTKRQREDAEMLFRQVVQAASQGGCGIYVMHGKPFFKKNTGSFKVDVDTVSNHLHNLCAIAGEYGVKIALENVHWAMCNNLEFIEAIKKNVPELYFTLDIKQANLSGIHWREYLTAFNERLINVHICDFIGRDTCMPGTGSVDFYDLAKSLHDVSYKGNVIIEVYDRDYKDYDQLKQCVTYCKNVFEI